MSTATSTTNTHSESGSPEEPTKGPPASEASTHPRWLVVSALGIMQIFAWGGSFYLITILAGPIAQDTGWPLPWIIASLSAGLLVSGFVSPAVGKMINKRGGRFVLALACPLLACGLVVQGLASTLPIFVLGWLIMGLGMGAGLYDAAFSTLGQIYRTRARTSITALTLWGGFASTVSWPLTAWLASTLGWRGTLFTYALIQLLVCLPLVLKMVPKPEKKVLGITESQPLLNDEFSLTAIEKRQFTLLTAAFVVAGTTFSILTIHLLTLLQTLDVTLDQAVLFGTLIGPAQVVGRIVEMAGRGRHHPLWTLTAAIILIAIGTFLLVTGFASIGVALVLYGAGNGIFSIARGTVPLALFGPDRYAVVMGKLARPPLWSQAVAPVLAASVLTIVNPALLLYVVAGMAFCNVLIVLAFWRLGGVNTRA